jgi:HAD superfamily hydrolase (TIGR01549 family)
VWSALEPHNPVRVLASNSPAAGQKSSVSDVTLGMRFSRPRFDHVGRVTGVLLDVDGTLLDSNDAHAMAYVDALRAHDIQQSFERVRRMIGMGSDRILPILAEVEEDSDLGCRIQERKRAAFRERYLSGLKPVRGARELVEHLRARRLKLVVASSAGEEELGMLLKAANVDDLIEHATSSDDAEESKPAPDIVEAAVQRAGLPKEKLVMIGDTPYDIESARKAGVGIIAVRSGGWDDRDLGGALAVYDDPADLLAHIASSPLAD